MVTEDFETALHEREGIEQPSQVNPYLQKRKRRELTTDDYLDGILKGDRVILSRAITLTESLNPEHQRMAQEGLRYGEHVVSFYQEYMRSQQELLHRLGT